jgi:hypothetical protein
VLRHENQVLRRQLSGRLRWDHTDRLSLTALSRLVSRRRWPQIFPVTSATILRWHRDLVARKWTCTDRRWPGRPSAGASVKTLIVRMARENPAWGTGEIQGEQGLRLHAPAWLFQPLACHFSGCLLAVAVFLAAGFWLGVPGAGGVGDAPAGWRTR